jgi:hypothetical protein
LSTTPLSAGFSTIEDAVVLTFWSAVFRAI